MPVLTMNRASFPEASVGIRGFDRQSVKKRLNHFLRAVPRDLHAPLKVFEYKITLVKYGSLPHDPVKCPLCFFGDSDLIKKYRGHGTDSRPMHEPSVIGDDGRLL